MGANMFLREGPQRQHKTLASFAIALITTLGISQAAFAVGGASVGSERGIEVPREILPWRRDVETKAQALLKRAQQTLNANDRLLAERQLSVLLRTFPRTIAAEEAKRLLDRLSQKRLARAKPSGLGVVPSFKLREPLAPVAGWQTTVKNFPDSLLESLVEAAGDRVFFKEGSARLDKRARSVLALQAKWLKAHHNVQVRIAGHADDRGSDQRNLTLAHDRAVAVHRQLIRLGVSPRQVRVFSFGNSKPIAICSAKTCSMHNRRVEMELSAVRRAESGQ